MTLAKSAEARGVESWHASINLGDISDLNCPGTYGPTGEVGRLGSYHGTKESLMINIWRVIASSPSDVQEERECLSRVIDTVNRALEAAKKDIRVRLYRWETDVPPGTHREGGQGLIESELKFDDADVVVGIFWKRLGTPVNGFSSGTEREITLSYEAWQNKGRPRLMLYFNTAPLSSWWTRSGRAGFKAGRV